MFNVVTFMICSKRFRSYGFGLRPKAEVFYGRKFGHGRRWKMWLRSNTEKIDNLKFKNKPRHLRLSLPLRFSLGILQLSKKMPSKNQHHRRPRKTIPTASSLCTHSCPRGSITSSSHVFTNPESMKPEFFQWKDQFFVVCFDLFLIGLSFKNKKK